MFKDASVRLIQNEAVEVGATYQGLIHRENGDILAEVTEHCLHLAYKVCLRSDNCRPLTILLLVHGDQSSKVRLARSWRQYGDCNGLFRCNDSRRGITLEWV